MAWLSEEGSLHPASWRCEARYPSPQYGKTLSLRVRPFPPQLPGKNSKLCCFDMQIEKPWIFSSEIR